jgi:hypothetical protein
LKSKPLYIISAGFFAIFLTAHLSAVFQLNIISPNSFLFFVFHFCAIAVFAPNAIALAKKQNALGRNLKMKEIYGGAPVWLTVLLIVCAVYALINFVWFINTMPYTVAENASGYYLHNHGSFIRSIIKEEYLYYQSIVTRGFSGHWIVFSCASMVMSYPDTINAFSAKK